MADVIDAILQVTGSTDFKVDRGRLDESDESWVYVEIETRDGSQAKHPACPVSGFGNCHALLTWPNSD